MARQRKTPRTKPRRNVKHKTENVQARTDYHTLTAASIACVACSHQDRGIRYIGAVTLDDGPHWYIICRHCGQDIAALIASPTALREIEQRLLTESGRYELRVELVDDLIAGHPTWGTPQ